MVYITVTEILCVRIGLKRFMMCITAQINSVVSCMKQQYCSRDILTCTGPPRQPEALH